MYTWLIIIFTLVVVGITWFLRYIRRNDDYWKERGVKYLPRQSFFTILKVLLTSTLPELIKTGYEFGKVYGTFSFSQPAISIADPKLLKDIFVKDFNYFSHRQDQFFNDKILDKMVFVQKGEDWKRVRTIISPAFTSKQMRKMENIINGCAKTVLKTFDKYFQNGEPVDCKAIFGAFVTDVIALAAFATKVDSLNNPGHIFVKNIKESNQAFNVIRVTLLNLIPRQLQIYLGIGGLKAMDFFKKVVVETIKERREKGAGEVGYDAVRDMKLMDAVVSETLRMYPPALMTTRVTTSDYNLGDTGIVLAKGIPVFIPLYAMHYDAEFFPDPEIFNPERFMDSCKDKHPQYAYLPFGEGPRNCMGMRFALLEIKLCMANILRHYRFKTHSTTKVPLEYKKYSAFLSVAKLPLALEKINPSADTKS